MGSSCSRVIPIQHAEPLPTTTTTLALVQFTPTPTATPSTYRKEVVAPIRKQTLEQFKTLLELPPTRRQFVTSLPIVHRSVFELVRGQLYCFGLNDQANLACETVLSTDKKRCCPIWLTAKSLESLDALVPILQ